MDTQGKQSSIETLASLLEQFSIGAGRITPGPRGFRLSEEDRILLARAVDSLTNEEIEGALLTYGNACFALRRHHDAVSAYRSVLGSEPASIEARFNLGLSQLRLRQPEQAVKEFTETLVRSPQMAEAYYQRGNAYDDLGDVEQALADYSRAIDLAPEYIQPMYNRGIVLASAGRHQEAVVQFDKVIDRRPDIGNAFLNRGASLDEMGLHEEAIRSYDRAAELNFDDPRPRFNRARTCYYLGRLEEALEGYTDVLRLDPDDAEAYNNRGLIFDALGDYESAVADYENASRGPLISRSQAIGGRAGARARIEAPWEATMLPCREARGWRGHYKRGGRMYAQMGEVAAAWTPGACSRWRGNWGRKQRKDEAPLGLGTEAREMRDTGIRRSRAVRTSRTEGSAAAGICAKVFDSESSSRILGSAAVQAVSDDSAAQQHQRREGGESHRQLDLDVLRDCGLYVVGQAKAQH